MGFGTLNCKSAEVNGTKKNRCVEGAQNASRTAKEPSKEMDLTRRLKSFMGVFSNDFAAVDVREELCYHSRPEKAKFGRVDAFPKKFVRMVDRPHKW